MGGLAILAILAAAVNSLVGVVLLQQVAENPALSPRRQRLSSTIGVLCILLAFLLLVAVGWAALFGAI